MQIVCFPMLRFIYYLIQFSVEQIDNQPMGCFNVDVEVSVKCIHLYIPLLYSENGVYRGKHIFFIFAPKYRLWVLGKAVLSCSCTNNQCFEPILDKHILSFKMIYFIFFFDEKTRCSLHG